MSLGKIARERNSTGNCYRYSAIVGFARLRSRALRYLESLWASNHGTALVESAIALPVFLLLVGGVFEFSFFIYQEQLATSGVRDAARYLALTADPTSKPNQIGAKNLAVTGSIGGGSARVSGWTTEDVSVAVGTVANSAGTYAGGSTIRIVTVSTSFVAPSLGFFDLLGLHKPTISAWHQERYIGGSAPG